MVLLNVYQHKQTGQFFSFYNIPEAPAHRSLRILKNTLRHLKKYWNLFLVCTYNDENVSKANSDDMRLFINRVKQFTRNKINKYKSILAKSSLEKEKNKFFIELMETYVRKLENFKYVWKVEFESTGQRQYNPHFHVLLSVPFWLKLKRIQKYWDKGSLHLESIKNTKKASIYVSKYFSKQTENFEQWAGKHWSKSRNIKTYKNFCRFVGQMEYSYAKKLSELTKKWELNYYEIRKVVNDWWNRRYSMAFILDTWHEYIENELRKGVT